MFYCTSPLLMSPVTHSPTHPHLFSVNNFTGSTDGFLNGCIATTTTSSLLQSRHHDRQQAHLGGVGG